MSSDESSSFENSLNGNHCVVLEESLSPQRESLGDVTNRRDPIVLDETNSECDFLSGSSNSSVYSRRSSTSNSSIHSHGSSTADSLVIVNGSSSNSSHIANDPIILDESVSPDRSPHIHDSPERVIHIRDSPDRTSPDHLPLQASVQHNFSHLKDEELATAPLTNDKNLERIYEYVRPQPKTEHQLIDDPKGLKVELMQHQREALAWLVWREQQKPPGGILGDDMGLGKTLTMISLILTTKLNDSAESDEEWENVEHMSRIKGGSLIVCPASLLGQWETEVKSRCKSRYLSVLVYHGTSRDRSPRQLAQHDIVVTTYNILTNEFKSMSTIYRIHWHRVILDEAHVIRNHKSQVATAVCGVEARKRWAVTGTPIHNKELDLYSILKFLKCAPFDDLRLWKRWVDNKNAAGRQRLAMVMKSLMLRRTKEELQGNGTLSGLPSKVIEEVVIELEPKEQELYEQILAFSRTLFAQFLSQRAEKADMDSFLYRQPLGPSNMDLNKHMTEAREKLLSTQQTDVKTTDILVLLLRLRQFCCHPYLIHTMLDKDNEQITYGIVPKESGDFDLVKRMHNINLNDSNNKENLDDEPAVENILSKENPIFDFHHKSSKMKAILRVIRDVLERGDKLVIVSQWTKMLDLISFHLKKIKGASCMMFTGNVPVKDRKEIMMSFNAEDEDPKILLLSLTAGGVGLNLIGGNHLLLVDIHWNPQLESQAQDRVYRFGQRKDVHIYKFICKDTIEERVKGLQDRKLEIASNVLGGLKEADVHLTMNDLRSLFAF